MVERYVRRALERGIARMDFLRGDEPYKYEWGAVDRPIQRLLVRRTGQPMTPPLRDDPCVAPMVHLPGARPRARARGRGAWPPAPTAAPRSTCSTWSRRLDRDVLRRVGRLAVAGQRGPQAPAPRHRDAGHRRAGRRHRHRHPRRLPRGRPRGRGPQPHVPGGDRGHQGGHRPGRGRPPPAVGHVHGPLVARPPGRGPGGAAAPDRLDGPPAGRVERHRPQGGGRGPDDRAAVPDLQRRRPRALRPPGALLHAPRRVRHGARLTDRGRGGPPGAGEGPSHAARGLAARPGRGPGRLPGDRGRGEPPGRAPRRSRGSRGSSATSCSPAAATTSRP